MKNIVNISLSILIFCTVNNCLAQNIKPLENPKKIEGLKDGYDLEIIYTGEVKDGKPSGKGLAIYKNNPTQKYFGDFEKGLYNGKGTLIYSDGRLATGNFKDGKYLGIQYLLLRREPTLGQLWKRWVGWPCKKIEADNRMKFENTKNGLLHGRVIDVSGDGKIISDNIYVDGKLDGQGYQYELEKKKLFEGIWKDNKWLQPSTGNYPSFMRSSKLTGLDDTSKIIISSNISSDKNLLEDTCYAFIKASKIRLFGNFHLGNLVSGMKSIGDNIKIIGQFNSVGFTGICVDYNSSSRLLFGNFKNDKIDGQGVLVSRINNEIYDGIFSETNFTGKASKLTYKDEIEIGNFYDDKLDGLCTIIKPTGAWMKGTYSYGSIPAKNIKKLGLSNGELINPQPININIALNELIKINKIGFDNIASTDSVDEEENDAYGLTNDKEAWFNFPNSDGNHIEDNFAGFAFYSDKENIKTFELINKLYNDLCNQILASKIVSLETGKTYNYVGKIQPLPIGFIAERKSIFQLNTTEIYKGKTPKIIVSATKEEGDNYKLEFKMDNGLAN